MYLKRFGITPYAVGLFVLVLAATLLRFVLISFNWPWTNSDESTIDLMALHIAYRGEHPIFYYGQDYMGSLEAYIGALCFRLFGVSIFSLRLGLLPLFALFLVCMYFLTRLLYNKQFALVTVALLGLGSSDIIMHQLKAIGGYPEILLLSALNFLLAARLALSSSSAGELNGQAYRKRLLSYALLGVCIGFAIYTDPLILPVLVSTAAILMVCCRYELRSRLGLWLLGGLLVGASPMLVYSILGLPSGHTTVHALVDMQRSGSAQLASMHIPWIREPVGALLISFPIATGLNPVCMQQDAFPFFGPPTSQTLPCTLLHGSWALGYLLLGGLSVALVLGTVRKYWRQGRHQSLSCEEQQTFTRDFLRLMLLASAAISLLLDALKADAAFAPYPTTRYLICMLIATPAVLWPLWHGAGSLLPRSSASARWVRGGRMVRIVLLLLIFALFVSGTVRIFFEFPQVQANYQRQNTTIDYLLRQGTTHIYTDYWTCNRLIFQSTERIVCGVVNEELQPGQNRYQPYVAIVKGDAHASYVFDLQSPTGLAQVKTFERQMLSQQRPHFQRSTFNNYAIYQPIETS